MHKPLHGQERVQKAPEVFGVEGPIDYLLLWQWCCPAVATLGSRFKQEHIEALRSVSRVYLVPHRDDDGRHVARLQVAFGERLRTVLVPKEMKDAGDLAEKATSSAQTLTRLMGGER